MVGDDSDSSVVGEGAGVSEAAEPELDVESSSQRSVGKSIQMAHPIHLPDVYTILVRRY